MVSIETVFNYYDFILIEIEEAREIVKLFEIHEKLGKGAFEFKGKVVDRPGSARNYYRIIDLVNHQSTKPHY